MFIEKESLAGSRNAAKKIFEMIQSDTRFMPVMAPELDIVVWAPKAERASEISVLSNAIFEAAALENLHLAIARFPSALFADQWQGVQWDHDDVTCLRSCLMKPEHLDWIERIWEALDRATKSVLKK